MAAMLTALPKGERNREAALLDFQQWKAAKSWQSGAVLADVLARKLTTGGRWRTKVRPGLISASEAMKNAHTKACSMADWHLQKGSLISAAEARRYGADLVLELGVEHSLAGNKLLSLTVCFKLVDPATGAVVARTHAVGGEYSIPLTELFDNNGRQFRAAFQKAGDECLNKCIERMGLLAQ